MRTQKIWRDGHFVDWADATIHVLSHVVHYGSSVFEGIRCYETPNGARSSGSANTFAGCTTRPAFTAWPCAIRLKHLSRRVSIR